MRNKKLSRRTLCGIGSVVVALALVITGAFAWYDNSQHKTNIVTGGNGNTRQDVVLVEDFESPPDWQEGDELKKEIWVKNTGDGQVYVRLQLKEYMEISKETYNYSAERLLVDKDGRFVSFADKDTAKVWLKNNNIPFGDSDLVEYTAYGETVARIYFATREDTPLNGRDGKFMLISYTMDSPKSLVDGVTKGTYADTTDHQLHPTSECNYTSHLWKAPDADNCHQGDNGEGLGFHDFVKWNLGDQIILLSEWNGEPVAKWILDDTSSEGWAYWGEALNPGTSTDKLLDSIKLIKQPDGPFYYALHVDMQSVDQRQLMAKFDGIAPKIADSFRGETGLNLSAESFTTVQGGTVKFKATWNAQDITDSVTWTKPTKGTVSGVGTNTNFNTPGLLTIGKSQPLGSMIVKISYDPGDGNGARTAEYVVTVKQPNP